MQWARIEKQHAAFERRRRTATQARAAAEVDVERRDGGRLECEPQRLAPFVEVARHPIQMLRRQVAGIDELEDQRDQVFVLDRRRVAVGVRDEPLPLDLPRACEHEERMQLGPFRGNPLLVAKQPDLGVEAVVQDLAREELGQERLPLVALRMAGDFLRERRVAGEETLRQVEQRLPKLILDLR